MLKRLFDIVSSSTVLLLTWPLFILIALLIKLDSPGPVFYIQWRVGKGQKPFKIYKFRTMLNGADQQGPAITVGNDKRITRVGMVLRRFELDELPTLLNVLKGEMSVVGPRPELPKYLKFYTEEQQRIFSVKPGMTDPGTVKFRNEAKLLAGSADPEAVYLEKILPEKLELNLDYLEKQSFLYDLSIIFRTFALILTQPKH